MVIGIVGKGKMGYDLFQVLLEYDCSLVLVGRTGMEEIEAKTEKMLNRKRKRSMLSECELQKRRDTITFTTDYNDLAECDFVLETVTEDLVIKREVLSCIESAVSKECMIATNTSSLDVNELFSGMKLKERCMGIHFFYPIKINPIVEISRTEFTEEKYVAKAKNMLVALSRNVLVLEKNMNLLISRLLTTIASYAYRILEEGKLSARQIDKAMKEKVMIFGPFEIIDATGAQIISQCLTNLADDRHKTLYARLYDKVQDMVQEQGNALFLNNEDELAAEISAEKMAALDEAVIRMKSVLVNEVQYYWNHGFVKDAFYQDAVKEALGLEKAPKEFGEELGSLKKEMLGMEYEKDVWDIWKAEEDSF